MSIKLIAALLLGAVLPVHALDLKPRHPDEPADYTFNQRFSAESALRTTGYLRSIIESFRTMTRMTKDKLSAKELKEIGNTDWDIQHLGGPNHTNAVDGTILKQDYLIKKLEYELAVERSKSGKDDAAKVAAALKDYRKAEETFQTFWNKFGIAD